MLLLLGHVLLLVQWEEEKPGRQSENPLDVDANKGKESDKEESVTFPSIDFSVGTNQSGPGRAAADCWLLPENVRDAAGRRHHYSSCLGYATRSRAV
jgi:hypothetical protein